MVAASNVISPHARFLEISSIVPASRSTSVCGWMIVDKIYRGIFSKKFVVPSTGIDDVKFGYNDQMWSSSVLSPFSHKKKRGKASEHCKSLQNGSALPENVVNDSRQ
jgi:hypothetical protein